MVRVHVIKSLFSFPLAQTCTLKAVKNMVAMVSVPGSVPKPSSLPVQAAWNLKFCLISACIAVITRVLAVC